MTELEYEERIVHLTAELERIETREKDLRARAKIVKDNITDLSSRNETLSIESLDIYNAVRMMKQTMERLKKIAPALSPENMIELIGVIDGAVFVIVQVDWKIRKLSKKLNASENITC